MMRILERIVLVGIFLLAIVIGVGVAGTTRTDKSV